MTTLNEVAWRPDDATDPRIRAFVEAQEPLWNGEPGDWVVVPAPPQGTPALIAVDVEGERRGREVVRAFVGPATASQASTARPVQVSGQVLRAVELAVAAGRGKELLDGLELLVSARLGITRHTSTQKADLADLLRDMRLALATGDLVGASSAYKGIDDLGLLSRENRRFLEIEYLAESERWNELVARPYFGELPRVRRPRLITEYMLEAIWFGIVLPTGQSAYGTLTSEAVIDRFGPLLQTPDIPRRRGALSLVYLASRLQGDEQRVERILAAVDESTRLTLNSLDPVEPVPGPQTPTTDVHGLLALQRYGTVVEAFVSAPRAEWVDSAVEAALELREADSGHSVLQAIEELVVDGFEPRPRLVRAIDELRAMVQGQCGDWLTWARRTAGEPWEGAAVAARDSAVDWVAPSGPEAVEFGDLLLVSSTGANAQAIVNVLDLLLRLSRDCLSQPSGQTVCDAVLLVLAEQENASDQVRGAFAELTSRALDHGMNAQAYRSLVQSAADLWAKVASPLAFDWALEILDSLAVAPCPEPGLPTAFASSVQGRAVAWVGRLSAAQRISMRYLTEELGVPPWPSEPEALDDHASVWPSLNGRSLALYSLTENAGTRLKTQLDRVCSLGQFTHNRDHTATAGLASLAQNADYMIVDTWHAAHQATGCIDQHRPRSEQILPRRGSTPALLAALEDWLGAHAMASAQ